MLSHLLFKDKLTLLFCILDDFLALLPKPNQTLVSGRNPAGCPANLTPSEVLTLALFSFWTTLGNWKAFYDLIDEGFRQEFPKLLYYETLLRQINGHGPLGLLLLIALLGRQGGPGTYALDVTAIPLSHHRRQAKVVRQWAAWGKDSNRHWFFGFKLHGVCDPRGQRVSLWITPGNVAYVTQARLCSVGCGGW